MMVITMPETTALMAPARLRPKTSSAARDGRDQVAFVNAARLIVDVEHAAADHHRNEHGQRDRAGQQIFHVFDVGIELDGFERDVLQDARLDHRCVERVGELAHLLFER